MKKIFMAGRFDGANDFFRVLYDFEFGWSFNGV